MTSGVPQCSILGPLLFLVNANDMPRYIQHGFSIALFVDHSKLSALLSTIGALIMAESSTPPKLSLTADQDPNPAISSLATTWCLFLKSLTLRWL